MLHRTIYPEACIASACSAYRKFLDIECVARDDVVEVTFRPLSEETAGMTAAQREFLNYTLDLAIKHGLTGVND
jgi:hypothetical protein